MRLSYCNWHIVHERFYICRLDTKAKTDTKRIGLSTLDERQVYQACFASPTLFEIFKERFQLLFVSKEADAAHLGPPLTFFTPYIS